MPFRNNEIGYVLELVPPGNEANRRVLLELPGFFAPRTEQPSETSSERVML